MANGCTSRSRARHLRRVEPVELPATRTRTAPARRAAFGPFREGQTARPRQLALRAEGTRGYAGGIDDTLRSSCVPPGGLSHGELDTTPLAGFDGLVAPRWRRANRLRAAGLIATSRRLMRRATPSCFVPLCGPQTRVLFTSEPAVARPAFGASDRAAASRASPRVFSRNRASGRRPDSSYTPSVTSFFDVCSFVLRTSDGVR